MLGARWIGLPLDSARRFVLGTASLSILGTEHGHANEPVIVLWNAGAGAFPEAEAAAKKRALDRWENEGGEIPPTARTA